MNNNKGFTMLEVIVSLFLLSMFVLLMTNIVNLTATISKTFLDYSDYEYALMHKKIFEMYNEALEVDFKRNKLEFKNDKEELVHNVVFTSNKIYKQTKNPDKEVARGYTLLLENINSYSININNDGDEPIAKIEIVDRENKYRHLEIKLKKQKKEEEKDSDNGNNDSNKEKNNEISKSDSEIIN